MRESLLVVACLTYLKARGILAWRSNNAAVFDPAGKHFRSFRGLKGVADILGVLDCGRLLAVGCKGPRGRLAPHQQWFLAEVNRRGGLALVVRDVRDLQEALGA